ncbi:MAG: PAS domain S-box protein [Proteobacteria bacterium]|nr:PAS domain S-box protein [Pseudomonadota bacterium]
MKIRINIEDMKIKEFHLIASFINKMVESINEREATINNNIEAINAALEEKSKIIKFERKKFLAILETIDDGLISIDPQGAITYFNRAAETITSIDRHMAIGRHHKTIFPSLDIHENSQVVAQELEINEPSSVFYLKLYISPYTLDSEEKGYILLFRDISKEKKIEEFKADFISSIAHDIKSFLMPVTGFFK